jgi:hypothetical protein
MPDRLQNERQLENTRGKLRRLEERCQRLQSERAEDQHLRDLTLRSVKAMINQMREEIAVFESRRASRTISSAGK